MRRARTVGTLLLSAGVLAAGAGAASAAGSAGSAGSSVGGSGLTGFPTAFGPDQARLDIGARTAADGADPQGHVTAMAGPIAPFAVGGAVTCVRVSGNRAAVKYAFDRATGSAAALQGGGIEVFVEDNGAPSRGTPTDRVAFGPPQPAGVFQANAAICDDPAPVPNYQPLYSGNYSVR